MTSDSPALAVEQEETQDISPAPNQSASSSLDSLKGALQTLTTLSQTVKQ